MFHPTVIPCWGFTAKKAGYFTCWSSSRYIGSIWCIVIDCFLTLIAQVRSRSNTQVTQEHTLAWALLVPFQLWLWLLNLLRKIVLVFDENERQVKWDVPSFCANVSRLACSSQPSSKGNPQSKVPLKQAAVSYGPPLCLTPIAFSS